MYVDLIECGGWIDCADSQFFEYSQCGGWTGPVEPEPSVCAEAEAQGIVEPGCSCIDDPFGYDCTCFHDPYAEHWDMDTNAHSFCHFHMCYMDDTIEGCPYHACTVNPVGVDGDGNYCPANPCFSDDTIEGCPNWACNLNWFGEDTHPLSLNAYCPGHECYADDTMPGCPNYVDPCVTYPQGYDHYGMWCPEHVCMTD
jgi:hypothetical protein